MSEWFRKLMHWVFVHPAHHHMYRYEALRDEAGNVRFFWRCIFILCGDEFEDTYDSDF